MASSAQPSNYSGALPQRAKLQHHTSSNQPKPVTAKSHKRNDKRYLTHERVIPSFRTTRVRAVSATHDDIGRDPSEGSSSTINNRQPPRPLLSDSAKKSDVQSINNSSLPASSSPRLRIQSDIPMPERQRTERNSETSPEIKTNVDSSQGDLPEPKEQEDQQAPKNLHDTGSSATPTARKPRKWASIKRHATTLASQISQFRQPHPRPLIANQAEFRRTFLKSSRDRIIRDTDGNCFRLCPIMMNGDCGFASIAKGINVSRGFLNKISHPSYFLMYQRLFRRSSPPEPPSKRPLQAKDIRIAMYGEIRKAKKTYLADHNQYGSVYSDADIDRLEREVGRQGIAGHWLGTVLGLLEHVIVAHAMNINIYLYQFDLQKQGVRQFEYALVENADCDVFLFFTGPPASGHFDTLLKISEGSVENESSSTKLGVKGT